MTQHLQFEPLSNLLDGDRDAVAWSWQGYVPQSSLTLLAAYPKVGKSTWTTALVVAVSRGDEFLGHPTTQCPVLWLSEEPRSLVRDRFVAFGAEPTTPISVHYYAGEKPEVLRELATHVESSRAGLVVIDTALTFMDIVDENDNAKVARALKELTALTRRSPASVLLVHHMGKDTSGTSTGRSIRGASAFLGYVDQALMLSPAGGTRRTLHAQGRYAGAPPLTFDLVSVDGVSTFQRIDSDSDAVTRVMRVLTDVPRPLDALRSATGLPEKTCRVALATLVSLERAVREGLGVKGDPHRWRAAEWEAAA